MGVRSHLLIASLNIFFPFVTKQILTAWFLGILAQQIYCFYFSIFHTFFSNKYAFECILYIQLLARVIKYFLNPKQAVHASGNESAILQS